jgi:hypothetical protein
VAFPNGEPSVLGTLEAAFGRVRGVRKSSEDFVSFKNHFSVLEKSVTVALRIL